MSLNLNDTVFAGRITADPELKTSQSGLSVTSFRIAVNRDYSVEGQQAVDFIPIVAWRKTAEFVAKYFRKGMPIYVRGKLQQRRYEDKNGNKHVDYEVVAGEVKFVESKGTAVQVTDSPEELEPVVLDDLPF